MAMKSLDLKGLACPQPSLEMTVEALSMKPGGMTKRATSPTPTSRRPSCEASTPLYSGYDTGRDASGTSAGRHMRVGGGILPHSPGG